MLAGLDFDISVSEKGLLVELDGYSSQMLELLKDLAPRLQKASIDEQRFLILKNDLIRELKNQKYKKAYEQLLYEMANIVSLNAVHYKTYYNPKENIDLISPLTLNEVMSFGEKLWEKVGREGLAYGSIKESSVKEAVEFFYTSMSSKSLAKKDHPKQEIYELTKPLPVAYLHKADNPNYCWGKYLQVGQRTPELDAMLRISHALFEADFFNQLRTEQQLGYIVHSGLRYYENYLGFLFLIQSSSHNPFDVNDRVKKWSTKLIDSLASLTDKEFDVYKQAVISKLNEPDKTIGDYHSTLYFEAVIMKGVFDYKNKVAQAASKITKENVHLFIEQNLKNTAQNSLTVFLTKESLMFFCRQGNKLLAHC